MNGTAAKTGNGCLGAFLALGLLLVGAGVALELVGGIEFPEEEFGDATTRGFDVPIGPAPRPLAPAAPVAPIAPIVEQAVAEPTQTLLWHAETSDVPRVPCMLRLRTSLDRGFVHDSSVFCVDGRSVESHGNPATLEGIRTNAGVAFRADLTAVNARDANGRPASLRIDTGHHEIVVTGATAMRLFVEELSVPHPSVNGDFRIAAADERAIRLAVPTLISGPIPTSIAMVRATGRAPRPDDSVCELTAGATSDGSFNCRLVLRCHGEVIYGLGNTGYNDCTMRDSRIVGAIDTGTTAENADPRIDLDLDEGHLIVSDSTPQGEWSATFDLIPDPRCGSDVTYFGTRRTEGAEPPFEVSPFSAPPMMTYAVSSPMLALTARCGSGVVTFTDPRAPSLRSALVFGPGARAVAGYVTPAAEPVWGFAQHGSP